jgi:TPR repeat protein
VQPTAEEITSLQHLCDKLCFSSTSSVEEIDLSTSTSTSNVDGDDLSSSTSSSSSACKDVTFHLATALLFNNINVEKGLKLFESLADGGDVRGKTAAGICYIEGLGVDSDEEKGSKLLKDAADSDFLQAIYELGVLSYNGNASPHVEENVSEAFKLFQLSASREHTSGFYMTADMLITGEGCEKDVSRAIGLLYMAGERGHRNARATLWAILREYE